MNAINIVNCSRVNELLGGCKLQQIEQNIEHPKLQACRMYVPEEEASSNSKLATMHRRNWQRTKIRKKVIAALSIWTTLLNRNDMIVSLTSKRRSAQVV